MTVSDLPMRQTGANDGMLRQFPTENPPIRYEQPKQGIARLVLAYMRA